VEQELLVEMLLSLIALEQVEQEVLQHQYSEQHLNLFMDQQMEFLLEVVAEQDVKVVVHQVELVVVVRVLMQVEPILSLYALVSIQMRALLGFGALWRPRRACFSFIPTGSLGRAQYCPPTTRAQQSIGRKRARQTLSSFAQAR
jgi:hypothetical protein